MSSQPSRFAALGLICAVTAALLQGCGGQPALRRAEPAPATTEARRPVPAPRHRSPGEQAAIAAVRQVGIPYRYGGKHPGEGFDCSGLVHWSYGQSGLAVPRTTRSLWDGTRSVAMHRLRVGDVLFFRIEGKVSHVGLYLGEGRFVHAPSSGRDVTVSDLDAPFYRRALVRAGRPY